MGRAKTVVAVAVLACLILVVMPAWFPPGTRTPPPDDPNDPDVPIVLVDERFDSGLDGWAQSSTQQAVIIGGELACTNQAGIYRDVPLDTFEMSFTMRFTANTWAFRVQLWSMILPHYRAIDLAHSSGYLTWGGSGYWPVQLVTGQTYRITIADVDLATHTFSVYVGDILAKAGIPFVQTCSTIDRVVLGNGGDGTVYFDDIKIVEA